MFCDSTSAIALAYRYPGSSRKTRHIEIAWLYVREMILEGAVDLRFCPTAIQLADGQTKNQPIAALEDSREMMLDFMKSKLQRLHHEYVHNFDNRFERQIDE